MKVLMWVIWRYPLGARCRWLRKLSPLGTVDADGSLLAIAAGKASPYDLASWRMADPG